MGLWGDDEGRREGDINVRVGFWLLAFWARGIKGGYICIRTLCTSFQVSGQIFRIRGCMFYMTKTKSLLSGQVVEKKPPLYYCTNNIFLQTLPQILLLTNPSHKQITL